MQVSSIKDKGQFSQSVLSLLFIKSVSVFTITYSSIEAFASIELTFGFDRMNSRSKQPSIELTRYLSRDNIEQESKIDT